MSVFDRQKDDTGSGKPGPSYGGTASRTVLGSVVADSKDGAVADVVKFWACRSETRSNTTAMLETWMTPSPKSRHYLNVIELGREIAGSNHQTA